MKFFTIILLSFSLVSVGKTSFIEKVKNPTGNEVINTIKANLTCEWTSKTVDTFKSGNPEEPVTGIVTTFIATMDVLKKAVEMNCNLIITHEPTFYNHLDQTEHLEGDVVYEGKLKYINDHGLMVFRFHDHWHRTSPDGIFEGMIDKLDWRDLKVDPNALIFEFPETTVGDFAGKLKSQFNNSPVRVIGNPEMKFTKVGLSPGAPGYMNHVRMLERNDVEVLVAGEVPEWESITYVRDAEGLDMKKAMILIGHVNSEEAGMKYLAGWLKGLNLELPIHYVPAGDPFWSPGNN